MTAVTCLSSIPTTPHLRVSDFELSCPVFLLLLWRDSSTDSNVIIFTDLQPVSDASISKAERVSCSTDYDVLPTGVLARNRLFLATVPDDELFDLISRTVKNIIQDPADIANRDSSLICQHGVLAKIEANLRVLSSGLVEGVLTSCVCIAPKNIEMVCQSASEDRLRLVQLLRRVKNNLRRDVVDAVLRRLPIEEIIDKSISDRKTQSKHTKVVARPRGVELVFGHHFDAPSQITQQTQLLQSSSSQLLQNSPLDQITQSPPAQLVTRSSQQNSSSQQDSSSELLQQTPPKTSSRANSSLSEKSISPVLSKISINSDQSSDEEPLSLAHFASALPTFNLRSDNVRADIENEHVYAGHVVRRATVADLVAVEDANDATVDSTLVFVVRAKIVGFIPDIPCVVKPYGRTVKLAPFKLVVQEVGGSALAMVELRNSEEVQRFLGLAEPEDCLRDLNLINERMRQTVAGVRDIAVQPVRVGNKYSRMYWRSMSVLQDLAKEPQQ